MMGLAAFVLANGLVAATSVLAVSLLTLEDALEKALAAITIALSQIVASLLVAGVLLDRLEPITIVVVNAAFLVAVIAARRLAAHGGRAPLALSTLGAFASIWRDVTRTPWLAVLLALVGLQVVWKFVVAYVLPPSGFDALWYHLTTVAWWLQEEEITTRSLSVWSSVYPANGELFFTWVAVFLRDDTFLDVVQLAFGLVGVLAVAGIARVAGLGRVAAAAAGAAFFLTPVVLAQASSSYVDLIFVSTFLVAAYWVLRAFTAHGGPSLSRLVLAGLAAGLALGSKSTGVVYCGVLLTVVVAWLISRTRKERVAPRLSVAGFLCFTLPLLVLGGYWYVRTWVTYGNPFYPVRVAVAGIELFDGRPLADFLSSPEYSSVWWKELVWQWHQDRVPFAGFRYFGVGSSEGGLGPVWSYLMLPALIPFVYVAAKRRQPILAAFFVPLAAIFALQPYRWWSRFTIYLLAAGAIALFSVIEWLPPRAASAIRWVAVVLVVVGISYSTPTKSVLSRLDEPRDQRSIGDVVAPWFKWVDKTPAGSRIAVDTTVPWVGAPPDIWFFYPLFGSRFENEVFPLPTKVSARGRKELAAQNIDYVVVGARGRYVDWARAEFRTGCFRRVFADEHALVYRRVRRCRAPTVRPAM
jgi:hypothetical protein